MAPEIWKGPYNAQEADLFACGIILFFMRTGKFPFYDATNKNSLYNKIIRGDMDAFWSAHEKKYPEGYFSEEFKHLLSFMFRSEPTMRLNLAEVYCHAWMASEPLPKEGAISAYFEEVMNINEDQVITVTPQGVERALQMIEPNSGISLTEAELAAPEEVKQSI